MKTTRVLAALGAMSCVLAISSIALAAPAPPADSPSAWPNPPVDNAVTLVYDPADGNLSAVATGDRGMTALELRSASTAFKAPATNPPIGSTDRPEWARAGLFDVFTSAKLFKLDPAGFASLDFGDILPAGWSKDQVLQDIQVDGALVGGGALTQAAGGGPFLQYVPEPASVTLAALGMLALMAVRRRS